MREDAADAAAAAAAEDELDADTWWPLDLQAVTQTGGAPRGAKEIRHHRAHKHTRRPPTRHTWARTHGPLALAWRTPERTPTPGYRASSCHIDTEGTRETGNMDIKKTNSIEHDHQKNKRAHIGEDATTGEEAESDGVRCRLA